MDRWEYRIVPVHGARQNSRQEAIEDLERVLAEGGMDGWELVSSAYVHVEALSPHGWQAGLLVASGKRDCIIFRRRVE